MLEGIDRARPQIVLMQQVRLGAEVQIAQCRRAEGPLIADVVNRQDRARVPEQLVPVVGRLEKQRRERGVPVVAMQDLGRPLHVLAGGEHGAGERQEAQVLIRIGRVQGRTREQLGAIHQVHRRARAREPTVQDGEAISVRAKLEPQILQAGQGCKRQVRAIDGGIQRREQADVVTGRMQVLRERRGDVREASGLRERSDLRGEQAHCQFHERATGLSLLLNAWSVHAGGQARAAQMRRVLISLTLTVLLIVSVGTGVAVATWPQWRHWLH